MGSTTTDEILAHLAEAERLIASLADQIRQLSAERDTLFAAIDQLEARLHQGAQAYDLLAARYEQLARNQSAASEPKPQPRTNTAKLL